MGSSASTGKEAVRVGAAVQGTPEQFAALASATQTPPDEVEALYADFQALGPDVSGAVPIDAVVDDEEVLAAGLTSPIDMFLDEHPDAERLTFSEYVRIMKATQVLTNLLSDWESASLKDRLGKAFDALRGGDAQGNGDAVLVDKDIRELLAEAQPRLLQEEVERSAGSIVFHMDVEEGTRVSRQDFVDWTLAHAHIESLEHLLQFRR